MKDYRDKQLHDFEEYGTRQNEINIEVKELFFEYEFEPDYFGAMPSFDEWIDLTQEERDRLIWSNRTQSEKDNGEKKMNITISEKTGSLIKEYERLVNSPFIEDIFDYSKAKIRKKFLADIIVEDLMQLIIGESNEN